MKQKKQKKRLAPLPTPIPTPLDVERYVAAPAPGTLIVETLTIVVGAALVPPLDDPDGHGVSPALACDVTVGEADVLRATVASVTVHPLDAVPWRTDDEPIVLTPKSDGYVVDVMVTDRRTGRQAKLPPGWEVWLYVAR